MKELLKKELDEIKKELEKQKDSEIYLTLNSIDEGISSYSPQFEVTMNENVAAYLENKYKALSTSKELEIIVDHLNDEDLHTFEIAKKNYYKSSIIMLYNEIKRDKCISLFLFISGIFALIIMILCRTFHIFNDNEIMNAVMDIASTVLIWEACTIHFVKRRENQLKMLSFIRLSKAKIRKK